MIRPILALTFSMAAPTLTTGCGDSRIESPPTIYGTYELQTYGGRALPAQVGTFIDGIREIISGSMELANDNTWVLNRTFLDTRSGNMTTFTEAETGTFTNTSGSLQFTWAGGMDFTGSVVGTTLTIDPGPTNTGFVIIGLDMVFRKSM